MEEIDFYADANKGRNDRAIFIAGALLMFTAISYGAQFFTIFVDALLWDESRGYAMLPNWYFLGSIWVFPTLIFALLVWFSQIKLRQRPLMGLITASSHIRWKRVFAGAIVCLALITAYFFLHSVWHENNASDILGTSSRLENMGLSWNGFTMTFWLSLPVILLCCPIDAALQEMFFRGHVDQGLSKYMSNRHMAFFISAVLFAVWHIGNPESYIAFWPYMVSMIGFGFLMSVLTYMDQGIEAAVGFHVANNLFYYLIVGEDILGQSQTALMSTGPVDVGLADMGFDLIMFFIAAVWLAHWRYGIDDKA